MPYIYKITNNINGKIYIGKTNYTIEKRWKEHCRDCRKESTRKRPLYAAMRKYGVDNFSVEEVERVETHQEADEREKYWIEYYRSFKYGYNATIGGDGATYIDYDLVYSLWGEGVTQKRIAELLKCHSDSISEILKNKVEKDRLKQRGIDAHCKPVVQLDPVSDEIINVFPSIISAEKYLNIAKSSVHISQVCRNLREKAYGFKWKFI